MPGMHVADTPVPLDAAAAREVISNQVFPVTAAQYNVGNASTATLKTDAAFYSMPYLEIVDDGTGGFYSDYALNAGDGVIIGRQSGTGGAYGSGDDAASQIGFWVKVPQAAIDARGYVQFTVFLCADRDAAPFSTYSNYLRFDGVRVHVGDVWTFIAVPHSDIAVAGTAGTMTFDSVIRKVRITADNHSSLNNATILIGSIEVRPFQKKARIALSADDGWYSMFQRGLPIIQETRLPFTMYVISQFSTNATGITETEDAFGNPTGAFGGYCSARKFDVMYKTGLVDIQNHTHTHVDLRTLDAAGQLTEIQTCRNWIQSNGWGSGDAIAYPVGYWNANTMSACRSAGMTTGRVANSTVLQNRWHYWGSHYEPYTETDYAYRQDCVIVSQWTGSGSGLIANATYQATLTGYVDRAITDREDLHLVWHDILPYGASATRAGTSAGLQCTSEVYATVMRYVRTKVDAGLCDVVLARDLYASRPILKRNPAGTVETW